MGKKRIFVMFVDDYGITRTNSGFEMSQWEGVEAVQGDVEVVFQEVVVAVVTLNTVKSMNKLRNTLIYKVNRKADGVSDRNPTKMHQWTIWSIFSERTR